MVMLIMSDMIIEGLFRETTRNGKHTLRSVLLALTSDVLFITDSSFEVKLNSQESNNMKNPSQYLIDSLKLTVFKKSQRQTLKICFDNETNKYFELEKTRRKKVMWTMWCKQVIELQQRNTKFQWLKKIPDKTIIGLDWNIVHQKWTPQHFIWNDKYLYLGDNREVEDQGRPSPVPGLGRAENIKFLYLKPQYFGCWDQSEHWVQCESSKHFSVEATMNII